MKFKVGDLFLLIYNHHYTRDTSVFIGKIILIDNIEIFYTVYKVIKGTWLNNFFEFESSIYNKAVLIKEYEIDSINLLYK